MATDFLVSRELKSLQDELSAAKTQRAADTPRSAATSAPTAPPAAAEPPPEPAEETEFQGQMRQFAHELTELFGDAEKQHFGSSHAERRRGIAGRHLDRPPAWKAMRERQHDRSSSS